MPLFGWPSVAPLPKTLALSWGAGWVGGLLSVHWVVWMLELESLFSIHTTEQKHYTSRTCFSGSECLCTFTDSQTLSLFRTALQKEHNQSLERIHCMSFQSGQKKMFPWQAWGHTRYNLSLGFCCGTQWKWRGPPEDTRRWFHFTLWLWLT